MEAENLVLNDSGEGEVVEQLGELLPHIGVSILAKTLVVESIPIKGLVYDNQKWAID